MIMEAGKSQDESERPRRANGVVPVQVWRPENEEIWWCNSSSKAKRLKTQTEPVFQFESEGTKKVDVPVQMLSGRKNSLYWRRVNLFVLFGPSTDWTRPTTLGRAICFTQSVDLNVNLIQKHRHRNIQNNVWPSIWATLWPIQVDPQN